MGRRKSQLNGREHGGFSSSPEPGTLYIVSTPIGHPDDLSLRALRTLSVVSIVAAENPAETQKLLAHHGIHAVVTSYGPGNLAEKVSLLIDRLRRGQDIALVVDGGTPVIHDPGQLLIAAVHNSRLPITILPGPSIITASMALSGYSGDRFVFAGKLPQADRLLRQFLKTFLNEPRPVIFLADPRTLPRTLSHIAKLFNERELTLAADLTKTGELVLRGTAGSLKQRLTSLPRRADVTLVLGEPERRPRARRSKKTGRTIRLRYDDG